MPDGSSGAAVRVHALGVSTQLTLAGSRVGELREAVTRAWSRCARLHQAAPSEPAVRLDVFLDDGEDRIESAWEGGALAGSHLDTLMEELSRRVTLLAISARQSDLVLLHAAGLVAPGSSTAVALVGPSGTGKTTAAAALGRTWGYLSDETVGVDAIGQAVAYPKPLSVLDEQSSIKHQVSPDELDLAATSPTASVGAVVLLERDDAVGPSPQATPLPLLVAVAALAEQTSCLRAHPAPLHRLAALVGQAGGVHRVRYAEADTLDPVLRELVVR